MNSVEKKEFCILLPALLYFTVILVTAKKPSKIGIEIRDNPGTQAIIQTRCKQSPNGKAKG